MYSIYVYLHIVYIIMFYLEHTHIKHIKRVVRQQKWVRDVWGAHPSAKGHSGHSTDPVYQYKHL